jgi:hypothetical protein
MLVPIYRSTWKIRIRHLISPPLCTYSFDPMAEDGPASVPWFVAEIPGDGPPKFSRSRKTIVLSDGSRLTAAKVFERFASRWLVESSKNI